MAVDSSTLRLICAALVVVFGVLIFLRRRSAKPE
jgi:hypothetical protein